jgi:hypothetical protein
VIERIVPQDRASRLTDCIACIVPAIAQQIAEQQFLHRLVPGEGVVVMGGEEHQVVA